MTAAEKSQGQISRDVEGKENVVDLSAEKLYLLLLEGIKRIIGE